MSSRRKDVKGNKGGSKKATKSSDPVLKFAETVRYHKDMVSRWGVLDESRVEFFRGQDFAAFVKAHPEVSEIVTSSTPIVEAHLEEHLASLLLKRKLIFRCDRFNKKIRPGKKKLSKFPARLIFHSDQSFSVEDGFFAWTFERSRPLWQTVLSFVLAVITVAACLFPVFPVWAKLSVLYTLMTLLCAMVGLLIVRWLVYGALWILLGKRIWFFPNILSDDPATLAEAFRFLPDFKDEEPPPKLLSRLLVTVLTVVVIWLSVQHAPDKDTRAEYRKKVTNIIDDVITWSPAMLAGNKSEPEKVPEPEKAAPPTEPAPEVDEAAKIEEIFARAADLASDLGEESLELEGNDYVDEDQASSLFVGSQDSGSKEEF